MHKLNTSFILGYHGCKQEVANRLLAGDPFVPSTNDYDWLGPGIYFWQSNPQRAIRFAEEVRLRQSGRWKVAVVGAVIDPGLCLDLATEAGVAQVLAAHQTLVDLHQANDRPLPENGGGKDLLLRKLDRAVIQTVHDMRANPSPPNEPLDAIDTVSGIFIEGQPIYENSGFYGKTHIQICVCNPKCIKGVFRVSDDMLGE